MPMLWGNVVHTNTWWDIFSLCCVTTWWTESKAEMVINLCGEHPVNPNVDSALHHYNNYNGYSTLHTQAVLFTSYKLTSIKLLFILPHVIVGHKCLTELLRHQYVIKQLIVLFCQIHIITTNIFGYAVYCDYDVQ